MRKGLNVPEITVSGSILIARFQQCFRVEVPSLLMLNLAFSSWCLIVAGIKWIGERRGNSGRPTKGNWCSQRAEVVKMVKNNKTKIKLFLQLRCWGYRWCKTKQNNSLVISLGKIDLGYCMVTWHVESVHKYKPSKKSMYFDVHFCVWPKVLVTYKSCIAVVKIIIENDTFLCDLLDLPIKSIENYTLTIGKKGIGMFYIQEPLRLIFTELCCIFYRILSILYLFHSLTIFTDESL